MSRTTENIPLAKTLSPTQQQIFDAVVAHSATMREHCLVTVRGRKRPAYRDLNGGACFIGGLLTDEEAEAMDKEDHARFFVSAYTGIAPARLSSIDAVEIISHLQYIHDDRTSICRWPEQFRLVAEMFDLVEDAVDKHYPHSVPLPRLDYM
jgi:hypothetical protein